MEIEVEEVLMNDAPEVRTRLLEIISQILAVPEIDPEKTFFDLGGSSLDAMTLVHEVNSEFGVDVPMQILFEASTIDELSRSVITLVAAQNTVVDDRDTRTIPI